MLIDTVPLPYQKNLTEFPNFIDVKNNQEGHCVICGKESKNLHHIQLSGEKYDQSTLQVSRFQVVKQLAALLITNTLNLI